MKQPVVVILAAMLICGLSYSSAATPSQIEDSAIAVSYEDLNIRNEAGARVLYTRLQKASEAVCNLETFLESGSLARVAEAQKCYTASLDKAVSNIDSKALKKLHSG